MRWPRGGDPGPAPVDGGSPTIVRTARLLVSWLALVAITLTLYLLGRNSLGAPPLAHPDRVPTWWYERGAVVATFALLRMVLLGIGCYLGALWTVALAAAAWRDGRPMRALCRCRFPGASRVTRAVLGVSALGAMTVAHAGPSFATGPGGGSSTTSTAPAEAAAGAPVLRYAGAIAAPVLRVVGPPRPAGVASHREPRPPPAGTHPVRLEPHRRRTPRPAAGSAVAPSPSSPPAPPPWVPAPGVPAPGVPAPSAHQARTWTVHPGDDLWSIAEATLTRAWGYPPHPTDLARYWWRVLQINRGALPNPADLNLLFPGDQIVLPAPPTAPR